MTAGVAPRRLKLRYAGVCRGCKIALDRGDEAYHCRVTRSVTCLACGPGEPVDPLELRGTPGASARREQERRRDARGERKAERSLLRRLLDGAAAPGPERAWATGAAGEERLGKRLEKLADRHSIVVLHDRRVPGTRANIDHLVITAAGVLVVDAKRYRGYVRVEVTGGILRPREERLMIGRRNQSRLIESALWQLEQVRAAAPAEVPIQPVLCFVDGDLPRSGSLAMRDVAVVTPKELTKWCHRSGPLADEDRAAVARQLALAFPTR